MGLTIYGMRRVFKSSEASEQKVEAAGRTGASRRLVTRETVGVKDLPVGMALYRYRPGEKTQLHSNPQATELLYVLSGRGHIVIDKESYDVEADTAIYLPSGSTHQINNMGNEDLRFLVVFCPLPF